MPAKEIKNLRQSGKLQEAYDLAKAELEANPADIWSKRNICWVLYDLVKANSSTAQYDNFNRYLGEVIALQLPADEKMLFDNLAWQVGKYVFSLAKEQHVDYGKIFYILGACKSFHFTKPGEGYSFLFKAFHKALKDHADYIVFADWWNLDNLRQEEFQKEKLPDGKEVMSVAEQAYIAYAKHLLPQHTYDGETTFNKEKVEAFLPKLDTIIENYPHYQYPPYFKAKLLLRLGDQENMLAALLPFAKKKRNDFWVWEVLSEAFPDDEEKRIGCYCRALTCRTSDDFLINLRQKMAKWFVEKKKYDEAKTEIELIVKAREGHAWKIPNEIQGWQHEQWFKEAKMKNSNNEFYKQYTTVADSILYSDTTEETIIIDFVNQDKQIANFIASETKLGFFKFDRFFKTLKIGDTLKVRFNGNGSEGHFQVFTAKKVEDEEFKTSYMRFFEGPIRIQDGKSFGFVEDYFVHPSLVKRFFLNNQQIIKGKSIKSYNTEKKQWGWKVISINN